MIKLTELQFVYRGYFFAFVGSLLVVFMPFDSRSDYIEFVEFLLGSLIAMVLYGIVWVVHKENKE